MQNASQVLTNIASASFHSCPSPVSDNRFPPSEELVCRMSNSYVTHSIKHMIGSPADAQMAAGFLGVKMNILLTRKFLSSIGKVTWAGESDNILMIGREPADTLRDLGVRVPRSAIVDTLVPYDVEVDTTDEDGEPTTMLVEQFKFLTKNILFGNPGAVQVYVDLEVSETEDAVVLDAVFETVLKVDLGRYVEVK